jgi:hypothetical protein
VLCATGVRGQTTRHVDENASGPSHDGTSWCSAYLYLQDALAVAVANDEILAADGTYTPDRDTTNPAGTGSRSATFQLITGVRIKGGYAGCGAPDPDARDIETNKTILSGDLAGDDGPDFANNDENAYNVVTGSGTDETAMLEGFTITAGNADGSVSPQYKGGGVLYHQGNATLADCTINANWSRGGGAVNITYSSPTITNCTFVGNTTEGNGGGLGNYHYNPTLINCAFTGNSAGRGGGGMYNHESAQVTLMNCTFSGNSANGAFPHGGGVYNMSGDLTLTNCTFSGNSARDEGGGMYSFLGNVTVANCIFWGNRDRRGMSEEAAQLHGRAALLTTTSTCIQGLDSFAGNGNIGDRPPFNDPDGPDDIVGTPDDDLRLHPLSSCIDAGNNESVAEDSADLDGDGDTAELVPLDLDGNPRFVDDPCADDVGSPHPGFPGLDIVDMGAYEYQGLLDEDPDADGISGCADNCPLRWNPDQADCDQDGFGDVCALALGAGEDCNNNDKPDECDIADETSSDNDANGRPDECQWIIFVDDDVAPGGDGTSWNTGYKHLQDALAAAHRGDEIRVAGGIYAPDQDEAGNVIAGDRTATFQLISGVEVTGGYAGLANPADPDERDINRYESTLTGDLLGNDGFSFQNNEENNYHVVTGSWTDATAILDGFTISGGNAPGLGSWPVHDDNGGGVTIANGSPTLSNCLFLANSASYRGGGLHISHYDSPGSPSATLHNCTFRGNYAGDEGGGMFTGTSDPTLTQCTFEGNSAGYKGGGLYNSHSNSLITECTFEGNFLTIGSHGGGMYNWYGAPLVSNCTFAGNIGYDGGGLVTYSSDTVVTGCEFTGNTRWALRAGVGVVVRNSVFRDNYNALDAAGVHVINCLIVGNDATAVIVRTVNGLRLTNCAIINNTGTGIKLDSASATVENCILWNNAVELQLINHEPAVDVAYSCIRGGWPGTGNIDADPLFVDADGLDGIPGTEDDDLRLSPGSPCIDAGDNSVVSICARDFYDNIRFMDDPATSDTGSGSVPIVDMGAHEFIGIPSDCDDNDVHDDCDLAGGADDCQANGILDVCESVNDCTGNGIADECDIADGTSLDDDGNGIPDECLFELTLPPPPHDVRKHRYISIGLSPSGLGDVAIKVEVAKMRRCLNAPTRACLADSDCDNICDDSAGAPPHYTLVCPPNDCSLTDPPSTCVPSRPCVDLAPSFSPPPAWLVQEPVLQADGEWTATLSDTVYSQEWSASSLLHISGCGIVPCVTYHVYACDPADLDICSQPLELATQRFPELARPVAFPLYGDVCGGTEGDPPEVLPPDQYVNVKDLLVTQLTLINYGSATLPQAHPTWVDLHGPGVGIPPQYILNVSDLTAVYVFGLTNTLPWVNTQGGLDPQDCP